MKQKPEEVRLAASEMLVPAIMHLRPEGGWWLEMLVHAEMHLRPEKVRLAAETPVPEERLLSRCA
jgi:hypothetical protein